MWLRENAEVDGGFKAWDPSIIICSKCTEGYPSECARKDEIMDMIKKCVGSRNAPAEERRKRTKKPLHRLAYTACHVRATGKRINNTGFKPSAKICKATHKFSPFITDGKGEKVPAAVRQGRVNFNAATPSKYGPKRINDLEHVIEHGLSALTNNICHNFSTPAKIRFIGNALDKKLGKCKAAANIRGKTGNDKSKSNREIEKYVYC